MPFLETHDPVLSNVGHVFNVTSRQNNPKRPTANEKERNLLFWSVSTQSFYASAPFYNCQLTNRHISYIVSYNTN
jgi:hypothetical protein